MSRVLRAAPVLLALCVGCKGNFWEPETWQFSSADAGSSAFLVVQPAAAQPQRSDLGVVVVIQSGGGSFLSLRTRGGSHALIDSDALFQASCVITQDETPQDFLVVPTNGEAILEVNLVSSFSTDAGSLVNAPCPSSATVLEQRVVPITARAPASTTGEGEGEGHRGEGEGGTSGEGEGEGEGEGGGQ